MLPELTISADYAKEAALPRLSMLAAHNYQPDQVKKYRGTWSPKVKGTLNHLDLLKNKTDLAVHDELWKNCVKQVKQDCVAIAPDLEFLPLAAGQEWDVSRTVNRLVNYSHTLLSLAVLEATTAKFKKDTGLPVGFWLEQLCDSDYWAIQAVDSGQMAEDEYSRIRREKRKAEFTGVKDYFKKVDFSVARVYLPYREWDAQKCVNYALSYTTFAQKETSKPCIAAISPRYVNTGVPYHQELIPYEILEAMVVACKNAGIKVCIYDGPYKYEGQLKENIEKIKAIYSGAANTPNPNPAQSGRLRFYRAPNPDYNKQYTFDFGFKKITGFVGAAVFPEGTHRVLLNGSLIDTVVVPRLNRLHVAANGRSTGQGSPTDPLDLETALSRNLPISLRSGDRFRITKTIKLTKDLNTYGGTQRAIIEWGGPQTDGNGSKRWTFTMIELYNAIIENVSLETPFSYVPNCTGEEFNNQKQMMPEGIKPMTDNCAVINCSGKNLKNFVNKNNQNKGFLLERTFTDTTLRCYHAWLEGIDIVVDGAHCEDSIFEHGVRITNFDYATVNNSQLINLDKRKDPNQPDANNDRKGSLTVQAGNCFYGFNNRLDGPTGRGPLGRRDGLKTPNARLTNFVSESESTPEFIIWHGVNGFRVSNLVCSNIYFEDTEAGYPADRISENGIFLNPSSEPKFGKTQRNITVGQSSRRVYVMDLNTKEKNYSPVIELSKLPLQYTVGVDGLPTPADVGITGPDVNVFRRDFNGPDITVTDNAAQGFKLSKGDFRVYAFGKEIGTIKII